MRTAMDAVAEGEAAAFLREGSRPCAVYCEEAQAVRLAASAARAACERGEEARVVVPNDNARRAVMAELGEAGTIQVLVTQELTERVLKLAAQRREAAAPVLLDSVQEALLFEDMKTLGGKPRRIREMLKFLCRSISELAFERDGWLVSDEERTVLHAYQALLAERGALPRSLMGAAALVALGDDEALAGELRVDVTYAVGFSALDRASQRALERLTGCLVAFGRNEDPGVPEAPFPFSEGLTAWAARSREVRVASPVRTEKVQVFASDAQERASVAGFLARKAAEGRRVTLVVPTSWWVRATCRALADADVAFCTVEEPALARADIRRSDACPEVVLYAALAVAAQPRSTLSRRAWIGLGDWLGGSGAWKAVRDQAACEGKAVGEVLDSLAGGGVPFADDAHGRMLAFAADRLREADELMRRLSGLVGPALLEELCSACGIDGACLPACLAPLGADEDAAGLFARLQRAMGGPVVAGDLAAPVAVATFDTSAYVLGEGVVVMAVVDGLASQACASDESAPLDQRCHAIERDGARLARCARLGSQFALLTAFERMRLADASRAGADIKRVYAQGGRHFARTAPSVLIAADLGLSSASQFACQAGLSCPAVHRNIVDADEKRGEHD
ncbi:hypothetical protein [Adlercreutzia sp. ZJ242]|uniref:hypothetical protein n=1 Tax=Adlercreutzia sp. ZJ242 TaxID=2709409 RepID=UPI0013EC4417|nr:hypothetical protein [Adlercreutzia sp. ZJ242]